MLVLKLGGSYITYKRMDASVPLKETEISRIYPVKHSLIRRLGSILKEQCSDDIIIVHGGGTHGHRTVRRWREIAPKHDARMMAWEVRYRMDQLTEQVMRALGEAGLPVYPVDPPDVILAKGGCIDSFDATPLLRLLERGMVPVMRGDLVPDVEKGWSVVSGDDIMVRLADLSMTEVLPGIDRAVMCMEASGFYPKAEGSESLLKSIDRDIFHSSYADWTSRREYVDKDESGGIYGKMMCAHMISARGIRTHLIGDDPSSLFSILSSGRAGTEFVPFEGDESCRMGTCAGEKGGV